MSQRPILIVDDDESIRDALHQTLTEEGYTVVEKCDGGGAIAHLQVHEHPGLVLLDWNMAPMNAPQFMTEFAKVTEWRDIPVILMTADMKVSEKVKSFGFVGYLKKPVLLDKLFEAITAHYR